MISRAATSLINQFVQQCTSFRPSVHRTHHGDKCQEICQVLTNCRFLEIVFFFVPQLRPDTDWADHAPTSNQRIGADSEHITTESEQEKLSWTCNNNSKNGKNFTKKCMGKKIPPSQKRMNVLVWWWLGNLWCVALPAMETEEERENRCRLCGLQWPGEVGRLVWWPKHGNGVT